MKVDKILDIPKELLPGYLSGKNDISKAVVRDTATGRIIKYVDLINKGKGSKELLIGIRNRHFCYSYYWWIYSIGY